MLKIDSAPLRCDASTLSVSSAPCAENSLCPALKGESGPVQAQKRPNLFCRHVGPFLG
jgi:hypothetical protein